MTSPKSIGFMPGIFMFMLTIELSFSLHNFSNLQCLENERHSLLSFKHGVIDPSNRLSSWEGRNYCKWHGVSCDNRTGHVVELDLHNPCPFNKDIFPFDHDVSYEMSRLNMVEVSPSLVQLKHLKYLDLSGNNFSQSKIPDFFGSFHKLEYLNLSSSCFSGSVPHHLGNLSSLVSLDLSDYFFGYLVVDTFHWASDLLYLEALVMNGVDLANMQPGSFQIITWLPSLVALGFSSCGLTFPFAYAMGNMTSLQALEVGNNNFGGIFPSVFHNLTSLKFLDLSSNSITSRAPVLDELNSLRNLQILYLSGNLFEVITTSGNFSFSDNLDQLDLSHNHFHGILPDFSYQLKNLKCLYLSGNSFHGPIPASFGTFPKLNVLDLSFNNLTGSIPSSLGSLSNLEYLDLGDNQLRGPIPTSIGNLSNMRFLLLGYNQLSGQIPTSLGKLLNLEILSLSGNSLDGVVSGVLFTKLSKLKGLGLGFNHLSMNITPSWAAPFQLEEIYLDGCNVGPQFPYWLHTQTRLRILCMSNSSISDSIPNWFKNFLNGLERLDLSHNQIHGNVPCFSRSSDKAIELILSFNRFEGSLPEFPSSTSLLDLSNNNINGSIPSSLCSARILSSLILQHNHLSGELPQCANDTRLSFVDLSFNHISGSIPYSFCNLKTLQYLSLSKSLLSGELPRCWNISYGEVLDFSFNQLEGTIPSCLFQSSFLKELYLSHNHFRGEIPKNLKSYAPLTILDLGDNSLSGGIPIWIADLIGLRVLRLRSNNFTGNLSTKLCKLKYLQILDVGNNQLSGNIPHYFGKFSAMLFNNTNWESSVFSDNQILMEVIKGRELEYIKIIKFLVNLDLSCNNLVGHIPEELTRLSGVISLNLSRNNLTGRVPYKIGRLTSLESLDFSRNCLTGRIPQSISLLLKLSFLDFSWNKLSGPIPSGYQLQTLINPTIYQGNDELCGFPLERTCHSPHSPTYVDDKAHKNDDSNLHLFYIGPILGFVVGFWVVCGTLFLKKTWRQAFFQFVDDI